MKNIGLNLSWFDKNCKSPVPGSSMNSKQDKQKEHWKKTYDNKIPEKQWKKENLKSSLRKNKIHYSETEIRMNAGKPSESIKARGWEITSLKCWKKKTVKWTLHWNILSFWMYFIYSFEYMFHK